MNAQGCGSLDLVKNGHDYKGSQQYHCKTCNCNGTLHAQRRYDQQTRRQVQGALLERIFGVHQEDLIAIRVLRIKPLYA
jgi:transposase-like protein